jgi:hypothetical protein
VTSLRQWAANRENAQKSTGPRTDEGKRRSRRNAFRHGLTAETVIEGLENTQDYRAFEATIIADYDARTAVERELVLRLASLLWRIRRATGIETDLLRIQAEVLRDRRKACEAAPAEAASQSVVFRVPTAANRPGAPSEFAGNHVDSGSDDPPRDEPNNSMGTSVDPSRQLTHCFLRLINLDNGVFKRLGRYEAALWRQIVQTLFVLQPLRRRPNQLE